jgi:hypothetical protein
LFFVISLLSKDVLLHVGCSFRVVSSKNKTYDYPQIGDNKDVWLFDGRRFRVAPSNEPIGNNKDMWWSLVGKSVQVSDPKMKVKTTTELETVGKKK